MGKLIKNHLARLLTLAAATYGGLASIHCFLWPKCFYDFLTLNLDSLVKPIPYLQIVNTLLALCVLAFEWPLPGIAKLKLHSSIELRLAGYPGVALCAALMYQGSDPGLWFLIATAMWFWAYVEGEVFEHSCPGGGASADGIYRLCARNLGLCLRGDRNQHQYDAARWTNYFQLSSLYWS